MQWLSRSSAAGGRPRIRKQPLGPICDVALSWFLVPAEAHQPGFEAPTENASGNVGRSQPIKPLASRYHHRKMPPRQCLVLM